MTNTTNDGSKVTLSKHDLAVIKRAVKTEMSGGFRQVFQWSGDGFREHWASHIALNIATARDGSALSADWLIEVRRAVLRELGEEE